MPLSRKLVVSHFIVVLNDRSKKQLNFGEQRKFAAQYESQKLVKFQNKIGFKGCKLSSLNAPVTDYPLSHLGWENSLLGAIILHMVHNSERY